MKDLRYNSNLANIGTILIIFCISQVAGQYYRPPRHNGSFNDLSPTQIALICVGGILFILLAVYIRARVQGGCVCGKTYTTGAPVTTQPIFTGVRQPHRENRVTAEPVLDSIYVVPTPVAAPVARKESLPPSYNDLFQGQPNETTVQSPPDYASGNPRDATARGLEEQPEASENTRNTNQRINRPS